MHSRLANLVILALLLTAAFAVSAQTERAPESYRLKSGDKIGVRFLNHPELNEPQIVVRPDGMISLQLIDDVKVEGRTTDEVRKALYKAYEEILLSPSISVSVLEFVPPAIFVAGQVQRPGKYTLRDADTLVKAIFNAGGFTREANRKMVLYAHAGPNGKWEVREINALRLIEGVDKLSDIGLADGDYVFVPDSKLSKFNKALEGFQQMFPVLPLLK